MPFIGAAITSVLGAAGVGAAAAASVGAFLGDIIVSAGLSLLARLVQGKPEEQLQPGIRTGVSTTGGLASQSFIVGRFATAGHRVCPRYCHGQIDKTPNAYATLIIELSDIPVQPSFNPYAKMRVIVGDNYSQISVSGVTEYGFPLLGQRVDGKDHAWVKFYDGTQTAADPMLVEKYGAHALRPWGADKIGTGIAYAIVTLRLNRDVYQSEPKIVFEMQGVPLYDPRKDTTVGGDGDHRWNDPATWEYSANPQVVKYNILRGISLPCGNVWGGQAKARDLPLSNWFAAMNVCDQLPDGYDGLSEQRDATYQCGYEIKLSDEPGKIIEELDKVCFGQSAEMGGEFRTTCGAPAAPVLAFSDEDISISDARDYEPFPGLESTHNGVIATYSEPESLWKGHEAPSLFDAGLEVADGNRRLPVTLSFPACSNSAQAQQLMAAYAADHRRFRTHHIVLPPEARGVKVLNTVSWTSERYGYENKLFEVTGLAIDPNSLFHSLTLRERDPSDTDWTKADELPAPANARGVIAPISQGVAGWAVVAGAVLAADDAPRRPALIFSWDGDQDEVNGLEWEVRHSGDTVAILRGSLHDFAAGTFTVVEGILASTSYEARARLIADRPREWSAWLGATTSAIVFGVDDLDPAIPQSIADAAQSALADKDAAVAAAVLAGEKSALAAAEANAAGVWALAAENSATTATEKSELAVSSAEAATKILNQTYTPNFANEGAYWIQGYPHSESQLEAAASIVNYPAVSLVEVSGIGTVLQIDGYYAVMSERNFHPVIEGQKIRVSIKTRLTVDPDEAAGDHTHFLWLVGMDENGNYTAYQGVTFWTGLTVADGWVIRTAEFNPAYLVSIGSGSFVNTTSWRLMVGLNGYDLNLGGAVQQFAYVNLEDITQADAAEGFASAASISAADAVSAKNGAESAEADAVSAKNLAVEAKNASETAAGTATTKAAEASQSAIDAVNAKSGAESAEAGAVSAKNLAVAAKNTAETEAGTATTKAAEASQSAIDAANAKSDAESAEAAAVSAKDLAVAAKNTAETAAGTSTTKAAEASQSATDAANAKSDAESAEAAAVSARDLAVAAKSTAETAAGTATTQAAAASNSASQAASAASNADGSATAAAQSVTDVQAKIDSYDLIGADYVLSRGQNLVTNGTGLLGDNTNFTSFTFDGAEVFSGAGAFSVTSKSTTRTAGELIPVDTNLEYRMSYYIKTIEGEFSRFYGFVQCYDIDEMAIAPYHVLWLANTATTLAAPLRPGDTTISLADSSSWINSDAVSHYRTIAIYGHKNSFGYTYPDYSYTRNTITDAWAEGGISGNVITLRLPFPTSAGNPDDPNGEWPIGTAVSNAYSGGSYNYIAGVNQLTTDDWEQVTGTIKGVSSNGGAQPSEFRPGTAKVRIGWLLNRNTTNDTTTNISAVSFGLDVATKSEVDVVAASVTTEQTARVNADSALATDITNLTATVGGHTSSISTLAAAQSSLETGFSATYQMKLVAGGAAGELGFYAFDDLTGDPVSGFVIDADYFTFKGNMALFDGAALQSSNYVLDTSGWRIDQAGNAQFNNLTVTGDMIADGAVSRIGTATRVMSNETLTSSSYVAICSAIEGYNLVPYDAEPAGNPAMIIYSGELYPSNNSAGWVLFQLYAYDEANAVWEAVDVQHNFSVTWPANSSGHQIEINRRIVDFGLSSLPAYSKFRMFARHHTSGSCVLSRQIFTIEQVNK